MHPATIPMVDLLKHCVELRTRRSGPGGQHRNKTETAVVLVHEPTGLSAEASERRSQAENRRAALGRLRLRLAVEHRTPADSSGPSPLWRSRTRRRQLLISPRHEDFPALVAEALDRLQADQFETHRAADSLGISPSQLVGLFRKSSAAWTALGRYRAAAGLPRLK